MQKLLETLGNLVLCIFFVQILVITFTWIRSFNIGESITIYNMRSYCDSMPEKVEITVVKREIDIDFLNASYEYVIRYDDECYCVLQDYQLREMINDQAIRDKKKLEKERKEKILDKFKSRNN